MGLTLFTHSQETNHARHFDRAGLAATWLVSDVRTKLRLQRRRLDEQGFVDGHAVLRASELWGYLLKRLRPDLTIISRELMVSTIASKLESRPEEWLHGPGAAKTLFEYIRQLLPILISSGANSVSAEGFILDDWFAEDEQAASRHRWQSWCTVAREIWNELEQNGIAANVWAIGLLAGSAEAREKMADVWTRDLIVDLGAQMSQVEADLLLEIAKTRRVTVFRPSPTWESDYPESRLAADWMREAAPARGVRVDEQRLEEEDIHEAGTVSYLRFPSAAAEVKQAVASVRKWLEAGIPAESIAIAAPDLEAYWPVLSLHLECEGIATSKSVVTALHSFPDVMRWLARLRSRVSLPQMRDLEVDVFGAGAPPLSFTEFSELFANIYDSADLELSAELIAFYEKSAGDRGRWSDDVMTRDEFMMKAALLIHIDDDVDRLSNLIVSLFKAVLEECPPDITFKPSRWVQYIGELAAKTEVTTIPGDPIGVQCLGLGAMDGAEVSHAVVMGLHDGALRTNSNTAIQSSDIRSIERATGWALDGEDRRRAEFEARWILGQSRAETILTFADTDALGTVQTPSWTWLAGAWSSSGEVPEQGVPAMTRLDLLARRDVSVVGSDLTRERLARERGERAAAHFGAGAVNRLSPSMVDAVSKCPLRYAFDSVLGPRTQGDLDLDPAAMKQGKLQHALLEALGRLQFAEQTDAEIAELLEVAKVKIEAEDKRPVVRTDQAWRLLRRKLVKLGQAVSAAERENRTAFPKLRTMAVELEVKGVVDVETGEWATVGDPGVLPFSGRIDRVDGVAGSESTIDGRFVLIDYKNRARERTLSAWKSNHFWQPLLYAMALEEGLFDSTKMLPDAATFASQKLQTAGAFLFDLTDKEKGSGLRVTELAADLFEVPRGNSKQPKTRADLVESFTEARERMRDVMSVLREGRFEPRPYKAKHCETCQWVLACRKPATEFIDGEGGE